MKTGFDEESDRLAALDSYRILDTQPEAVFDNITKLASQICNTPVSLITLVDRERQWFKARVGFGLQESERESSICSHAILTPNRTFVINDLSVDERFKNNRFVKPEDGIRFYAGTPLVDSAGHPLGTLCVVDVKPRHLSESEEFALRTLATAVVELLEVRRRNLLFNFFYDRFHEVIDRACPYFLFIDLEGRIRRFGSNFHYCILGIREGKPFGELFEWEGSLDTQKIFSEPTRWTGKLLFFRNRDGMLRFRGAIHLFEDFMLVLSAPVINSQSGINDYGITLKDVPKHDYLSEYLFLQQTTTRSLRDAQLLMDKIKQRSKALEEAQEEIISISLFSQENPSAILRFDESLHLLYRNPSATIFMKDFSIDGNLVKDPELLAEMKMVVEDNLDYRNNFYQRNDHFYSIWFRYFEERKYLNLYATDITVYVRELNRKESELEAKNIELEQIREDLEVALRKETEVNQIKSRFVSMTSHEFRTPLTTIQSNAELMEIYLRNQGHFEGKPPSKYIGRVTAEVLRLTSLMNDILLLGRIEAGRIPFNPASTDMKAFINELLETNKFDPIEGRNVQFFIEGESRLISADPFLLNHILLNLLSNAFKYSRGRPAPELILSFQEGSISIIVRDHGIGVPQGELEKVFESFFRASNVENIQGTGLGLAIVKQFVDMHGGTINIQSMPGSGLIVNVSLPS